MSFETDIISKYGFVFDGRLFWDAIPDFWSATTREQAPFGILQQVGGMTRQYVNDKEQPEFCNARVQLYVWGKRRNEVADALRAFAANIKASNSADWYARELGEPTMDSNEVLSLRGSRQDFDFHYRNPYFATL